MDRADGEKGKNTRNDVMKEKETHTRTRSHTHTHLWHDHLQLCSVAGSGKAGAVDFLFLFQARSRSGQWLRGWTSARLSDGDPRLWLVKTQHSDAFAREIKPEKKNKRTGSGKGTTKKVFKTHVSMNLSCVRRGERSGAAFRGTPDAFHAGEQTKRNATHTHTYKNIWEHTHNPQHSGVLPNAVPRPSERTWFARYPQN